MKILFILPYVPYPLDSGGNQAVYTMLRSLKEKHEVSLLLTTEGEKAAMNVDLLKKALGNVTVYHHRRIQKKVKPEDFSYMKLHTRIACKFFRSVASSMERKISRRRRKYLMLNNNCIENDFVRAHSMLFANNDYLTSDYCKYVANVVNKGFDIIQVEFFELLPLVYILPSNVRKIFVHHELRFIRIENEMNLFKEKKMKDYIEYQLRKSMELHALSQYDDIITLSEVDKQILKGFLPNLSIHCSPAAITVTSTTERIKFKESKNFVFVGSGGHTPNPDGMIWFCHEVLPILRKLEADPFKVYIVGNWDSKIRWALTQNNPEIVFPGFIEDLASFLNGKISIIPIRIGSGIRIKILEAVSSFSPFVTTSKGCEGLNAIHRQNCLIADTPMEFAQAMSILLHDTNLQDNLSRNAFEMMKKHVRVDDFLDIRNQIYLNNGKSTVG